MDVASLRQLVAQHEGTRLDFKKAHYEQSSAGNAELAKDLMAMANSLPTEASVAHILVGVEEADDRTGHIVGVPPNSHPDDASLHQKVQHVLNRVPNFAYRPVESDTLSVGVFEIRGGGRPFFAIRDSGTLRRNCAMFRDGSSTDVASPDQILEWAVEDNPESREIRAADLRRARSLITPKPVLVPGKNRLISSMDHMVLSISVENHGETGFTIRDANCAWSLTRAFCDWARGNATRTTIEIGDAIFQEPLNREPFVAANDTV